MARRVDEFVLRGYPVLGERTVDAVRRRAHQELGLAIDSIVCVLPDYRYRAVAADGTVENELCPVFRATATGPVHPATDEVMDHTWVAWNELRSAAELRWAISPWAVEQIPLLETAIHDGTGSSASAQPEEALGIREVVTPQPRCRPPHERFDQRRGAQGVDESGPIRVRDHGLQHGGTGQPVGTGAQWGGMGFHHTARSFAVDDAHTTVRGSGLVNSATTGMPSRPTRKVTATRKRSNSSGRSSSAGGEVSTSSRVNEYG